MKIFGKRKRKSLSAADDAAPAPGAADAVGKSPKADEDVPSYFAGVPSNPSKKKGGVIGRDLGPNDRNGDDILALLAADPSELTAKQRRLVKRHKARDGSATAAAAVGGADPSKDEAERAASEPVDDSAPTGDDDARAPPAVDPSESNTEQRRLIIRRGEPDGNATAASKDEPERAATEPAGDSASPDGDGDDVRAGGDGGADPAGGAGAAPASDAAVAEVLAKMEGLNSKDRRKFLRELRSSGDARVVAAAEERARKVAERNESVAVATAAPKGKGKRTPEPPAQPEKKKRKKGRRPPVSLEGLPPDERRRREEQRRMQIEAVARREAGLVDPDRHPLNSERRRANRRKPSRAAQIAQAKREKAAERGRFNAVGYQMRRDGGGGGGGGEY